MKTTRVARKTGIILVLIMMVGTFIFVGQKAHTNGQKNTTRQTVIAQTKSLRQCKMTEEELSSVKSDLKKEKEKNHALKTEIEQLKAHNIVVLKEKITSIQAGKLRYPGKAKSFFVKGVQFPTRWIPAGQFMIGSPLSEKDRIAQEESMHDVSIRLGMWVSETEVTQEQYQAIIGSNPSHFKDCGQKCPVENVSWHDGALFANKMSELSGLPKCFLCQAGGCEILDKKLYLECKGWRFLTEAEWEYAARAGTSMRYSTGNCITTEQANFNGLSPANGCSKGTYRKKTLPVGSFAANMLGLYDMHGNVSEWVADWHAMSRKMDEKHDPLQLLKSHHGQRRLYVVRGGGMSDTGASIRSAFRTGYSGRTNNIGLRLARR